MGEETAARAYWPTKPDMDHFLRQKMHFFILLFLYYRVRIT